MIRKLVGLGLLAVTLTAILTAHADASPPTLGGNLIDPFVGCRDSQKIVIWNMDEWRGKVELVTTRFGEFTLQPGQFHDMVEPAVGDSMTLTVHGVWADGHVEDQVATTSTYPHTTRLPPTGCEGVKWMCCIRAMPRPEGWPPGRPSPSPWPEPTPTSAPLPANWPTPGVVHLASRPAPHATPAVHPPSRHPAARRAPVAARQHQGLPPEVVVSQHHQRGVTYTQPTLPPTRVAPAAAAASQTPLPLATPVPAAGGPIQDVDRHGSPDSFPLLAGVILTLSLLTFGWAGWLLLRREQDGVEWGATR